FYSDFTLMTTALRPHGLSYISPSLQCASIDHAMYFHKPFRADEWMLYDMDATQSASSRGLNFGRMWQNGELVCSTTQEGLIRLREIETQYFLYFLLKKPNPRFGFFVFNSQNNHYLRSCSRHAFIKYYSIL